jgi:hypothetical protein
MNKSGGEEMKRIVLLAVIAASAAVMLSSCMGPAGDVYIAFDWVNQPLSIACTDPSVPLRVFAGAYYQTLPDRYYVEYTHPSYYPSYRYLYYSLTANEGKPGFQQGDDARFTVWLYETMHPIIVMDANPRAAISSPAANSEGIPLSIPQSRAGNRIQQYDHTETMGGYVIHVQGGVIEPIE